MESQRAHKILIYVLVAAGIAGSSLHLLNLISEPDFFWHLKTGEWIWQHRSLPIEDPFSYTSPARVSSRAYFILTSYWLCQAIYYLCYLAAGMHGIVILRFIITCILTYALIKRGHGDNIVFAGLLVILLTALLELYPLDRPQAFSFISFAAVLLLLEKIKAGDRSLTVMFSLSAVMLLWANMHGGHVVGQGVILLYIIMEGIKFIHPSLGPSGERTYARLVTAGGLGVAFSLANPNTYHAVVQMAEMPEYLTAYNFEYQSTVYIFRTYNIHSIILYWSVLLLACAGLIANLKKQDITEIVLLAGTGIISFIQIRYGAFFMIAALPFIGRMLSGERVLKWARPLIFAAAFFIVIFFAWDKTANAGNPVSGNWVNTYRFPVKASEFILKSNIRGNMFNYYDWGGYLIWRLGPEKKVFNDGRGLYPDIYAQSLLISTANGENIAGKPFWKAMFDAYGVRFVVIPLFQRSGRMLQLVSALVNDSEWVPVFLYRNSMVFVRNSPENYHAIKIHSIPKDHFIEDLLEVCNTLIKANPGSVPPYIAKGDLYLSTDKLREAKETYEKAAGIAPLNPDARERLDMFK